MHYLNDLIQLNIYDLGELAFTNSIPERKLICHNGSESNNYPFQ
jgi:hypothetical protein